MFENLFSEPIADGSEFDQAKESGSQLLEAGRDGPRFLEPLKEVFHMVTLAVVASVVFRRVALVGFRRDARFEAERLQHVAEGGAAVRFVREDRPRTLAFHEVGRGDAVVAVAGSEEDPHGPASRIYQGVDLGVGAALGFPNALVSSALRPSERVLVDLRAAGVQRPELAFHPVRKRIENAVPDAGLAPGFPARVDGGVGREDAQGPPRAPFPQPEEHRQEDRLGVDRWSPAFRACRAGESTRLVCVNFFSRLALAASFGWIRMLPIGESSLL